MIEKEATAIRRMASLQNKIIDQDRTPTTFIRYQRQQQELQETMDTLSFSAREVT